MRGLAASAGARNLVFLRESGAARPLAGAPASERTPKHILMELASKYNPAETEGKWYEYWLRHKLFSSRPDGRRPYTVVIPPPNVTGVLHMGHVLNETIQDILVRRARMEGKNACWVPGTDHASIATEAKVVARLAEQGVRKSDLTREEFLRHAWDWTREHGGIILEQLRRLGASCDWDRTAFTMDAERSASVTKVFCELYRKGLIYRGVRMVNWDPQARTALSDEEVVYKEEHSKLYYLRYYVEDPRPGEKEYAVVATTRPETIMGDTAMCINPGDAKNAWLKGRRVAVPLTGRVVPVIEDEYVDAEFGTGCLKVTPAHDVNDYMLGQKHGLESIDIFNDDGTISAAAGLYAGLDRFETRKLIAEDLAKAGLLERTEDYDNNVGYSERTQVPIEPKLSMQWFLSMKHFAEIALPPVMNDEIRFYPSKYKNVYRHWLENIKDWCISRQLWWGHRIPAYYLPDGGFVVAETPEKALALAREKCGDPGLTAADMRQEEAALDTWFSSWLWPISLFGGISRPTGNEEFEYYYPTDDLVTGPDIIFFWVARMIMAGCEFTGKIPFRNVYFTGIVRDKAGRKMSKQLGNSPDPLDLISRYGADGVRMGMMLSATAGNDILFDESLCEQGRNFCNKVWNSFRLIKGWEADPSAPQPSASAVAADWLDALLRQKGEHIAALFAKYRLSEALMEVYILLRDEFSGWYLEMIKPPYGTPIDGTTYNATLSLFEKILQLLHPFMPFITEELWHQLRPRKEGESIMYSKMERSPLTGADKEVILGMETAKEIVTNVRAIRAAKNISPRDELVLHVVRQDTTGRCGPVIMKMGNIGKIELVEAKDDVSSSFMVGVAEYAVPLGSLLDADAEREKARAKLEHLESFLASIERKLSNEKFVSHAPQSVVDLERKKRSDTISKIKTLRETLESLR